MSLIKKVIKNNVINDLREMKDEPKFNTKGNIYCVIKLEDGEYKGISKTYKQQSTAYDYARKLQYKSVYSVEHEKYFVISINRSEVYDLKKEEKITNEKVTNETIRSIISDCVNYVEQKSKNEEIKNQYEMAKDKAVNILNSKGIQVSEDEIDLLIESFVSGLKKEVNNNGR